MLKSGAPKTKQEKQNRKTFQRKKRPMTHRNEHFQKRCMD